MYLFPTLLKSGEDICDHCGTVAPFRMVTDDTGTFPVCLDCVDLYEVKPKAIPTGRVARVVARLAVSA